MQLARVGYPGEFPLAVAGKHALRRMHPMNTLLDPDYEPSDEELHQLMRLALDRVCARAAALPLDECERAQHTAIQAAQAEIDRLGGEAALRARIAVEMDAVRARWGLVRG